MNSKYRVTLLCGTLLFLVCVLLLSSFHRDRDLQSRRIAFQTQLEIQAKLANDQESKKIESGEIWVGELHKKTDPTVLESSVTQGDLNPLQRVFGLTDFGHNQLSADTELHQCHPGSADCTTGGSVTLSRAGHTLCVITLGFLHSETAETPSHYRIDWNPSKIGDHRTLVEKLEILDQFTVEGLASGPVKLYELMKRAYSVDETDNSEVQDQLRREIVVAIFRSILESRSAS